MFTKLVQWKIFQYLHSYWIYHNFRIHIYIQNTLNLVLILIMNFLAEKNTISDSKLVRNIFFIIISPNKNEMLAVHFPLLQIFLIILRDGFH